MLGETIGSIVYTSTSLSGYLMTSTNQTTGIITTPQTRLFHIHLVSSTTASNITIQNGQGGITEVSVTGTISNGADFDFGWWGIVFPLGAYITYDGNQLEGVITCKGEPNDNLTSIISGGGGGTGDIQDDSGNFIQDDSGNFITSF